MYLNVHVAENCDYDSGPYYVTFAKNAMNASLTVNITDDDLFERLEKFNLVISNSLPNRISRVNPYRAMVSIEDDEKCK